MSSAPNLQPPRSQIEEPTGITFSLALRRLKEREDNAARLLYCGRGVGTRWTETQSSSRGNCLAGTGHGLLLFGVCSTSTKNPYSHVSPWFSSSWVTFHSKGHRDQKKGFFSQLPATFRSRSQGIRRTYFPASSEGLKSLARMAAPCSRLLVLFSEYWKGERRGNRSHHPQLHKIMNVFIDETLVVHSLTRDERQ